MAKTLLPVKKTELLAALPGITFVDDEDVDQYRCEQCGDVALHHYVAICGHTFCRKCYGRFANKACPVGNCSNASINKVSQNDEFDEGVYNLKVYCTFKTHGCNEILSLSEILDHISRCTFSINNILPKLWTPTAQKDDSNSMMEKLINLERAVEAMQQEKVECSCQSVEQTLREEIEQLRNSFEEKLMKLSNDLDLRGQIRNKIQDFEKKIVASCI